MKTKNIKYFCFGLMMVVLCFPWLQSNYKVYKEVMLYGSVLPTELVMFNWENWSSGDYQKNYEKNNEEVFGCRTDLIRLINQIDYNFFKRSNSNDVVVGKNDYLFQQSYIDAYYGTNYAGDSVVIKNLKVVSELQEILRNKNQLFISVLEPSKVSYFPEFVSHIPIGKTKKSYKAVLEFNKQYKVNLFDFNKWFVELKNTTPYPLYPKQGIHWTDYGASIAMDSIIKIIEEQAKIDLPDYKTSYQLTDNLGKADNDLGDLLNIGYKLPHFNVATPSITFSENLNGKTKPKVLIIGDSYFWNIQNISILDNIFSKYNFWYYNNTIYPKKDSEDSSLVSNLNIIEESKKYDIIIFMQTEISYQNMGFGFAESYLSSIGEIDAYKIKIRTEVLNNTTLQNKLNINTSLSQNSLDVIVDSLANFKKDKLQEIINNMNSIKEWNIKLKLKAEESGIPLEKVMHNDALWIFEKDFDITKK